MSAAMPSACPVQHPVKWRPATCKAAFDLFIVHHSCFITHATPHAALLMLPGQRANGAEKRVTVMPSFVL